MILAPINKWMLYKNADYLLILDKSMLSAESETRERPTNLFYFSIIFEIIINAS